VQGGELWASTLLPTSAMSDISDQLKALTMRFALDTCALIKKLPRDEPGPTVNVS
jgi:hypothetical protein